MQLPFAAPFVEEHLMSAPQSQRYQKWPCLFTILSIVAGCAGAPADSQGKSTVPIGRNIPSMLGSLMDCDDSGLGDGIQRACGLNEVEYRWGPDVFARFSNYGADVSFLGYGKPPRMTGNGCVVYGPYLHLPQRAGSITVRTDQYIRMESGSFSFEVINTDSPRGKKYIVQSVTPEYLRLANNAGGFDFTFDVAAEDHSGFEVRYCDFSGDLVTVAVREILLHFRYK
jgi:hypothetical protein